MCHQCGLGHDLKVVLLESYIHFKLVWNHHILYPFSNVPINIHSFKIPSMISSIILALAFAATVSAHGFVQGVEIDGT